MWKTGDFLDFAQVGPVERKLGRAGRVEVNKLPGPVLSPSPPLTRGIPRKEFLGFGFRGLH